MGRLGLGSIAKRAAISAVAIYALLLQGFLAASVPAAAHTFPSNIGCADNASGQGAPGGGHTGHHCPCCILACACAACACTGTPSALIVFPTRAITTIDFSAPLVQAARAFLRYCFAARGPPQDI